MQQKLAYIDALRGVAILLVIMLHASQYGSPVLSFTLNQVVNIGNKGVQLFYVATAFTLFLSFKHKLNKEKYPFKNFFLRRFFRIAPMYYLGIVYYLYQDGWGARYWLGDEPQVTLANVAANFLFIHGLNPYWINSIVHGGWSIAIEMLFYAFVPYLFLLIKNINAALNFFVFSLFLRAGLQLVLSQTPLIHETYLWNDYLFIYFPNQLPVFAIGIILYFIVIEKENLQDLKGSTLLLLTTIIVIHLTMEGLYLFPMHIVFSAAFLLLSVALSKYQPIVLVNPVITYIEKVSFSMYIVHFAVLHWLKEYNFVEFAHNTVVSYVIRFCVATSISVVVATIFYHTVEVPFQQLGKKLIDKLENA